MLPIALLSLASISIVSQGTATTSPLSCFACKNNATCDVSIASLSVGDLVETRCASTNDACHVDETWRGCRRRFACKSCCDYSFCNAGATKPPYAISFDSSFSPVRGRETLYPYQRWCADSASSLQWAWEYETCDGVRNCDDGSDETNCSAPANATAIGKDLQASGFPNENSNCDFESPCPWKMRSDQTWTRQKGPTLSLGTGPPADHTSGNGNYLYVETSGLSKSTAVLFSPVFNYSSEFCLFRFAYYMVGDDVGSLRVVAVENQTKRELHRWERVGQQPEEWLIGGLPLPNIRSAFYLDIIVEHDYGFRGDVAVDDLEFVNCSPDIFLVPCPKHWMQCSETNVCVAPNRLCDFTDDCLDGEDENATECSTAPSHCDFESDLCGWKSVQTNDQKPVFWHRRQGETPSLFTGPTTDHTTGKGYYLYLEASSYSPGDRATLRSGVYDPPFDDDCTFRFYHSMHGSQIGILRLYMRELDDQGSLVRERVLYARAGNAGLGWSRAEIPIRTNRSFELYLDAERGGNFIGDIAIDDLSFGPGCANRSFYQPDRIPIPTANCSFESNFCGWTNDDTNLLMWLRHRDSTPSLGTGPDGDHTLGTLSGYYAFVEVSGFSRGAKGMLISPFVAFSNSTSRFAFWYHMYGEDIGCLGVGIRCYDAKQNYAAYFEKQLWRKCSDQGLEWIQAIIPIGLCETGDSFQVVMTAEFGFGFTGDIAIDDVDFYSPLENSPCPSKFHCAGAIDGECVDASAVCDFKDDCSNRRDESQCSYGCDFETGWCHWNRFRRDSYTYVFRRQNDDSGSGSTSDFASGNFYLVAETSPLTGIGSHAELQSTTFGRSHANCTIALAYYMNERNVGTLSISVKTASSRYRHLKSLVGAQGSGWKETSVVVGEHVGFRIVVQATAGYGSQMSGGDIAIDDIRFSDCVPAPTDDCVVGEFACGNGRCISADYVCDFEDDCFDGSDEIQCPDVPGTCDFEISRCGWTSPDDSLFRRVWLRHRGRTLSVSTGPAFDHTRQDNAGYYLYAESSMPDKLTSQLDYLYTYPPVVDGSCVFRFWYHMWGRHMGTLQLVLTRRPEVGVFGAPKVIFEVSGNQGNHWHRAGLKIYSSQPYTLQFRIAFQSTRLFMSDIALDDISLTKGCETGGAPTLSVCPLGQFQCENRLCVWKSWRCDGVDDCGDNSDENRCTSLKSNCKSFEISCSNQTASQCVSLSRVCDGTDDCEKGFDEMHCQHACSGEFQCNDGSCLPWKSVCDFRSDCSDFSDENELRCARQSSYCDFESGPCDWYNVFNDDFDWRGDWGGLEGAQGRYWFVETYGFRAGDAAVLRSVSFEPSRGDCWISFDAYLTDDSDGKLELFLVESDGDSTLLIRLQNASLWSKYSAPINANDSYWLEFRSIMGLKENGNMALDNVALSAGCSGKVLVNDSIFASSNATCDFERGMCAWENAWNNSAYWRRYSREEPVAAMPRFGPSHDHTLKTTKGHYACLAVKKGTTGDGSLVSPVLERTESSKRLTFWYHLYGPSAPCLRVFVTCARLTHRLWQLCGNQNPSWKIARATIPPLCVRYQLTFASSGNGSRFGDACLDDVAFDGSSVSDLPCGPKRFQCDNGYCVHENRRCDFASDCGDGSDEIDCTTDCTFEIDACNWRYDDSSWRKLLWKRVTVANDKHLRNSAIKPTGDHTTGSPTGHFLFAKALFLSPVDDDVVEIRSKRFGRCGDGCTIEFYYFVYGGNTSHLSVLVRSSRSRGLPNRRVWTPSDDGGSGEWKKGVAKIGRVHDFEVVFVVRGGNGGWNLGVALDDIRFENCSYRGDDKGDDCTTGFLCGTGVCIDASRVCDYAFDCGDGSDESNCVDVIGRCSFTGRSSCGWYNEPLKKWSAFWVVNLGRLFGVDTGSLTDVTGDGYFLYTNTYFALPGEKYRYVSPLYPPNIDGSCRFTFWFHMFGKDITNLTLYAEEEKGPVRHRLWTRSGNQGAAWLFAEASVFVTTSNFRFAFESFRGIGPSSEVNIDGLSPSIECEKGGVPVCGVGYQQCPATGECLPSRWWCDGSSDCRSDRDEFNCPPASSPCWSYQFPCDRPTANGTCVWKDLWCDGENDCADGSDERNCPVGDDNVGISIQGKRYPTNSLCTFERDECGWIEGTDDDTDWQRWRGPTRVNDTGPDVDHTLKSQKGHFLLMESASLRVGARAVWLSTLFTATGWNCSMSFAYHMRGRGAGALSVQIRPTAIGLSPAIAWKVSGDKGSSWHEQTLDVSAADVDGPFRFAFVGERGTTETSQIAIDDVAFKNCNPALKLPRCDRTTDYQCHSGKCVLRNQLCDFVDDCGDGSDEIESECVNATGRCNFEIDLCDWISNFGFSWLPSPSKNDPLPDRSRGRYLYLRLLPPTRSGEVARLTSGPYARSRRGACVARFYFRLSGSGELGLYYEIANGSQRVRAWSVEGDQGDSWHRVAVSLSIDESFVFVVEGKAGDLSGGEIGFDDFSLGENCRKLASNSSLSKVLQPNCDFESSCVNWSHSIHDADIVWVIRSGENASGPIFDRTTMSKSGRYLYLNSSRGLPGHRAGYVSSHMQTRDWGSSITFWYFMFGKSVGCLSLSVFCPLFGAVEAWKRCGSQGYAWRKAVVEITHIRCSSFEVHFIGEQSDGSSRDIAIDDISFSSRHRDFCLPMHECGNYSCIDEEKVCNFVADCFDRSDESECASSCDFERDTCYWEAASTSSYSWYRKIDENSISGYYLYAFRPSDLPGEAILESTLFPRSIEECTLEFYYRTDTSTILSVRVGSSNAATAIQRWSSRKATGTWVKASAKLGKLHFEKIYLVANFTSQRDSGISLDDLRLVDCYTVSPKATTASPASTPSPMKTFAPTTSSISTSPSTTPQHPTSQVFTSTNPTSYSPSRNVVPPDSKQSSGTAESQIIAIVCTIAIAVLIVVALTAFVVMKSKRGSATVSSTPNCGGIDNPVYMMDDIAGSESDTPKIVA